MHKFALTNALITDYIESNRLSQHACTLMRTLL
jgi:hypothetical protein